jgi:hypothetical protein
MKRRFAARVLAQIGELVAMRDELLVMHRPAVNT